MGCPFSFFFFPTKLSQRCVVYSAPFFYYFYFVEEFLHIACSAAQTAGGIPFFSVSVSFSQDYLFMWIKGMKRERKKEGTENTRNKEEREREREKERSYKDKFETFMNKHTRQGRRRPCTRARRGGGGGHNTHNTPM